jgi:hypothetical protein
MIPSEQSRRFPCACCGFLSLSDPRSGSYEICPVCAWEDDPVQNSDPSFAGGANRTSLESARQNYVTFGSSHEELSNGVRPPTIEEVPPPWIVRGLDSSDRDAAIRGCKILLLGVVRSMLCGRISTFDGCTAVSALAWSFLSESEWGEFAVFDGVASEVEDLPNAATRHRWSLEALQREDARATDYEGRVKTSVRNACIRLQDHLQSELLR